MYTKALSVPRLTCQARVGAILTHHGHGHTTNLQPQTPTNANKLFFLITISTLHSESVMLASSLPIQSSRPYRPQYRNDDPYAKFDSGKRKLPRSDQSWDDMAQCFVAQPAGIGQAITKSPRSALAVTFWGEWLKWSIVICWG